MKSFNCDNRPIRTTKGSGYPKGSRNLRGGAHVLDPVVIPNTGPERSRQPRSRARRWRKAENAEGGVAETGGECVRVESHKWWGRIARVETRGGKDRVCGGELSEKCRSARLDSVLSGGQAVKATNGLIGPIVVKGYPLLKKSIQGQARTSQLT